MSRVPEKKIGYILSCFTRSLDDYHLNNNRIHLISSVLYDDSSDGLFIDRYKNYINSVKSDYGNEGEFSYLFMVGLNRVNSDVSVKLFGSLIVAFVSLDDLIGHLNFTKKSNELFEDIFGKKGLKCKDFGLNNKNCFFIFSGLLWSNIVLRFKLGGIDISGGSNSKRHILSSVDYQLFRNVEVFYNDKDLVKRLIFSSFKSLELSSGIPLDLYNKYLDTSKRINPINYNLLSNTPLFLKEIFHLEEDNKLNNEVFSLLRHNLNFSFDILKSGIVKNYEYELENLKLKLQKLKSEISVLEYSIERIDGLSSIKTKNLSNKDKKLHKKELSSYTKDPKIMSNLSENKLKLNKLLNKYTEDLDEISNKEKYLEELKKNLDNKNLNELNNLFLLSEKKGLVMNKKNRFITHNSYEAAPKLITSYRQYSTNRKNNLDLVITDPIPLVNKNNYKEISLFSNNKEKISNEFSFYFNSIFKILHNENLTNKEKQLNIENLWFKIMESAYKDTNYLFNKKNYVLINKLKKAENTLNLMFNKGILKQKFPYAYDYLNDFNLLMITYLVALNSATRKIGYTATARLLGSKIIQYLYYKNKKETESSKENISEQINFSYEDFFTKLEIFTNEEIIRLGDFFLNILTNYPSDIFEREFDQYESYMNSVNVKIKININNYQEILDNLVIESFALPMVCPPNLWSNTEYGGYLLNNELKEDLITGSKNHGHTMINPDSLIQTINYMSSIKFKINEDLINYILQTKNDKLSKELFQGGSSLQNLIAFNIAITYINIPIYIPTLSDWRGRIYTKPFYVTYQGNDFSLSLLEFWDGQILTEEGLDSLYIYGANLYNFNNISKDSLEARKNWVKTNINNILKMDNDFINGAENKLVFIAFCLTIRDLKKNPNHLVKLPVFLDATCSGIQHLAALMKDKILGSQVNLIKQNKNSKPEDFYSKLLKPINDEIQRVGNEDPKYSNLSHVELKRNNVKRPIMTKPYNASVIGMKESLLETFVVLKQNGNKVYLVPGINNETVILSSLEALKIASIIYNIIYSEFPSLNIIYDYFINMAKVLNKLNMPITWITPAGIQITQKYHKSTQRKVAISLGGKSKKMVLKEWLDNMDKNKQTSAIIPNIIHSLDASHIMQIINTNLKTKNYSIITVHDCFGTHPNNLKDVSEIVKSEFIKLYTQTQFLEEFYKTNIDLIKKLGFTVNKENDKNYILINENKKLFLPEIPKTGDLNFSDIQFSEHMIT
uniref:DNA-directed RNA polymerase n=1 Tax=Asterophora parasitica TaxID=117018 RepID=A0A8F1ACC4_9AGAR|nr:RNA polymerase [Asterophora parasitica]